MQQHSRKFKETHNYSTDNLASQNKKLRRKSKYV